MAPRRKTAQAALAREEEASFRLLDEWLRIENEHTDPGFVLPSRGEVVGWVEGHAALVLLVASLAVFAPVISALAFG